MKWGEHIYLAKVAARNRDFLISQDFIEGVKYPDRVGKGGGQVLGVEVGFPHHSRTQKRISLLVRSLRKRKLDEGEVDPFALGALCHLVQDSEVPPASDIHHEEIQRALHEVRYSPSGFEMKQELLDGLVLSEVSTLVSTQGMEPREKLRQGFLKTDQIIGSITRERYLPDEYMDGYMQDKESLEGKKRTRVSYWLLTYLSMVAPYFAFVDRKAIFQKDMVKRYSFVRKGLGFKTLISSLGLFTTILGAHLGILHTFTLKISEYLSLPGILTHVLFRLSSGGVDLLSLLLILSFLLPLFGQLSAFFLTTSRMIREQTEWFKFPDER